MKIAIVGPGVMPIPPTGWGAVEILVHDLRCALIEAGHTVAVVNTRRHQDMINEVNKENPDFVHIHYEDHHVIAPYLNCRKVAVTNHYAYFDQPKKWGGYANLPRGIASNPNLNIFALSQKIADTYSLIGVEKSRIQVVCNGVRDDLFQFRKSCKFPDRTMYLAKIDYRKRQHMFQTIPEIFYAGNIADSRFNRSINYLGEWSKKKLYSELTDYSNLALLSDGEAHPLVCLEALASGLGLVLSEYACSNLDLSLPFIDVIPESDMSNLHLVRKVIKENSRKSISMRNEIREYSKQFSWTNIVKNMYIPAVENIA